MNCHEDKNGMKGDHKHSPLKHVLHMAICCGLPIGIILLLPFIARVNPGASRILGIIAPFICPVMMIGMFGMMSRGNRKSNSDDHTNNEIDNKGIQEQNKSEE